MTINFDALANTYTVQDEARAVTFTAADRTGSSGSVEVFTKSAGGASDELKIYGNVRTVPAATPLPVQLSYVTYGEWTYTSGGLALQPSNVRQTFALVGFPTPAAAVPVLGIATYSTTIAAVRSEDGAAYDVLLPSTATFTANFGTSAVTTQLSVPGMSPYLGTGPISGNQFGGMFSSATPFFVNGSFAGGFFGPTATEMGYVFNLFHHNPDPYAGASVMPMDTRITGVVLGAKN